jgi:ADP-dependent NAD(P)H-hydrate dehydratase / NAD(P)H-hydrate epimerase
VKVVDCMQMAAIDRRAQEEFLFPQLLLMENAGLKAWNLMRQAHWQTGLPPGTVVFLAGTGNNGGDALVMARQHFLEGGKPLIVLAGGEPAAEGPSGANFRLCVKLGIPCLVWPLQEGEIRPLIDTAAWIFDGIAGTGLRGPLRPPLAALAVLVGAASARVVAIDVPSGVGDGFRAHWPAVRASMTLALGLPKVCLFLPAARPLCGTIRVVGIGFPPSLIGDLEIPGELLDGESGARLLPAVPPDAHKGTRGSLAVFAGSPGTTGAAWLAASAAARARSGLVSAYLDPATYRLLASRFLSVMAKPWCPNSMPDGFDAARHQGLLVGPGWGTGEDREEPLSRLLACGLPGVLDADGLTLYARLRAAGGGAKRPVLGGRWVLTPHPGEFSRLMGIEKDALLADPLPAVREAAKALDAVVVLKGACTWIASMDGRYAVWDGMDPTLATAGSGDVLAGIIAAILAGGADPFTAARVGVVVHAKAGRLAHASLGWFLAEDLAVRVSEAMP